MEESAHKATTEEVAQWMLSSVLETGRLYQETGVYSIRDKFGEEFTYINENGNLAIDKNVLKAFRKISNDLVIWERGDRAWRQRADYDQPGRQQD